jgi:hypothetical protein
MIYPLLKCPLEVRERLCGASKSQRPADVVTSHRAEFTFKTRQADLESYSVTHFQITDFLPNCCDNTGRFMAKCQRLSDYYIPISIMTEVMKI